MNICFVGFGNMAIAIAKGLLSGRPDGLDTIFAYDPNRENLGELSENVVLSKEPLQAVSRSKYVFICVKPQNITEALAEIKPALTGDKVIVSIAAGVAVERIKAAIEGACPVIRVMPNTPLLIGSGTTAIARQDDVSDEDYEFVFGVFSSIGTAYEIPKDKFNEIIPVNGSSPAFIYLFAKLFATEAQENGIDFDTALRMFSDTLKGSADMILKSGTDVDTLIEMVCSKGGTTLAALDAMRESGFEKAVKDGFEACVKRAYELG